MGLGLLSKPSGVEVDVHVVGVVRCCSFFVAILGDVGRIGSAFDRHGELKSSWYGVGVCTAVLVILNNYVIFEGCR